MTPHQIILVQRSFALAVPVADLVADMFYDRLFDMGPELRSMFPDDMAGQKKKLMAMLATAVVDLGRLDRLVPAVRALGHRHAAYGVTPDHFALVGAALLRTLELVLGNEFTPEVKAAWIGVYTTLTRVMLDGMREMPKAA